jgi:centrosomal protein CEP135
VTVDTQIEPYKADNAKLVKENNDLHMQLLKLREETDEQIRGQYLFSHRDRIILIYRNLMCNYLLIDLELRAIQRRLEHENEDLRFLNDEYLVRLRAVEAESAAKSARIMLLQDKTQQAIVHSGLLPL